METPSAPLGFNHNYIPLRHFTQVAILQVHHLCSLNQNYSSYCHRTQGNLYPLLQSAGKTVQIFSYTYDTLYHQQYSTSKSLMPCNDCTPTLWVQQHYRLLVSQCWWHGSIRISVKKTRPNSTWRWLCTALFDRERCCLFTCCSVYCCLEWFRGITMQEVLRLTVSKSCVAAVSG